MKAKNTTNPNKYDVTQKPVCAQSFANEACQLKPTFYCVKTVQLDSISPDPPTNRKQSPAESLPPQALSNLHAQTLPNTSTGILWSNPLKNKAAFMRARHYSKEHDFQGVHGSPCFEKCTISFRPRTFERIWHLFPMGSNELEKGSTF